MDDTRMFEKMAVSLAQTKQWQVHVVGWGKPSQLQFEGINFHALGAFARISLSRFLAPVKLLKILIRLRPEAFIVTTHELLWIAVIAKTILDVKIYYDVRENYYLNILYTRAFGAPARSFVAGYVRVKEWLTSPFINHFFLAEQCYANELPFLKSRWTIIENKSATQLASITRKVGFKLLFSGTLDESTGVFEAIRVAEAIHAIEPTTTLTIIGHSARPQIQKRLNEIANVSTFIQLKGITNLVPHPEIQEAIKQANAGIIYYQPSPHTSKRIPTKLYEYLALELPIIYDSTAIWKKQVEKWQAGVAIDFYTPDIELIKGKILLNDFYPSHPQEIDWANESEKLLTKIQ